jgi:3-oxoacyl-[acyl-carrier-protein] synthase II
VAARVVVTGTGVISSLGDSPDALHTALVAGQSGIQPIEQVGADRLDPVQGGPICEFSPENYLEEQHLKPPISPMPRVAQFSVAALQRTLEAANVPVEMRREQAIGLVLGTMFCSVGAIAQFDRMDRKKPLEFANTVINAAAGKAAICHQLTGVNSTISTGLTSGLHAMAYAAGLIRSGQATALLAGGAEELSFESLYGFSQAGLACPADDKQNSFPIPFDARRNGFAPGEGAAFLMLEEAESARARGVTALAEVRGQGNLYDTSGGQDPKSAVEVMAGAMRMALEDAGMDASAIDCVSAAANGSVRHDRWEAQAIAATIGSRVPVIAIKSMLGETQGAGGALQAVSLIESLRTGTLPGHVGWEQPEEDFPLEAISQQHRDLDLKCGLINAIGFDGHCSSLILSLPDEE